MREKERLTYKELTDRMRAFNKTHNWDKEFIKGVIVFTKDSFNKEYSLESRSYVVCSNCKAWIPSMLGYSIFGSALDGSDDYIRLDRYMYLEHGGENGWKVDYCYMLEDD